MKKRSFLLVAAMVTLMAMLLCACGGNTTASANLTDDPAVYWNAEKGAARTAGADGTYTIKVAKDGAAVDLKVADQATMEAIDKLDVFGIQTNDAGAAAAVKTVADMGYTEIGWEYYVDMIGGKIVKLNKAETLDSDDEVTIEIVKDTTGVYDMSGCSEFIGQATSLQAMDQVKVLKKGEDFTHVFVYGRDGIIKTVTKKCEACGKDVVWNNWFYDDKLPDSGGHYYLEKDVTVTAGTESIGGVTCLDLNGKTIKQATNNQNIYTVKNEFNLMDSVGTGKILPSTWNVLDWKSDKESGRSWGQGFNINGNCVLNIYGGTIDASAVTAQYGVCINNNGELNIYGGKLIGGETWGSGSGAVCNQGKMTMSGGEIIGGKSMQSIMPNKGGAAMRSTASATFVMTGGKIVGGTTDKFGGAINLAGQAVIKGGEIVAGSAGQGGDAIWVYKTGKLTLGEGITIDGVEYEK